MNNTKLSFVIKVINTSKEVNDSRKFLIESEVNDLDSNEIVNKLQYIYDIVKVSIEESIDNIVIINLKYFIEEYSLDYKSMKIKDTNDLKMELFNFLIGCTYTKDTALRMIGGIDE